MFVTCHLWREQNPRHKTIPLWYVVRKNNASLDVNVRMRFYTNYYQKGSYMTDQIGAIYEHAVETHPKRQHTRNMGYGGVTNATLRSKNQLLQQQPHAHRVAGCCCEGAGLLLGGRIVAWCSVQKAGKKRVPSTSRKARCASKSCVRTRG